MRLFLRFSISLLILGLFVAATPATIPSNAPSPIFGQAIWEIIRQKWAILNDFPALDKCAKYGYWSGISTAISGLLAVLSFYFFLSLRASTSISMVSILLLFLFLLSYGVYTIGLPAALLFGAIALKHIKERPDEYSGKRFAMLGIIFSLIWIFISFIYLLSII